MVRELFDVTPDAWQDEALEAFPTSPRLAMKACAGPGKTAVLSWIGWNFLLTRPHSIGGATSVSGPNLRANLWTELARWRAKSPILMKLFEQTQKAIFARVSPETWKLEARTWAQDADASQIGNALAGLHGEYVLWLLDETGDYPDAVMPVCESIFAGNPIEAHIVQAGNPTRLSGPLYRAATVARKLWRVIEITADPDDPKRTPRVTVEHARTQIEQYGRDNPWVVVRIFGQFPPSSFNALIGPDAITAATLRSYRPEDISKAARVLGVDVALYGDDASVIFPRQGLVAFAPQTFRNLDGIQGASQVSRKWDEWDVDACFVDNTGGYGTSWIDNLRLLGRTPIGVGFAEGASNNRYVNKRAEMYFDLAGWIKGGGQLPPMTTQGMPEVCAALSQTTYTTRGDRLLLEPKALVKEKIGYSPDHCDALALTFAHPVSPKASRESGRTRHISEWDYGQALTQSASAAPSRFHRSEYDPFS